MRVSDPPKRSGHILKVSLLTDAAICRGGIVPEARSKFMQALDEIGLGYAFLTFPVPGRKRLI